MRIPLNDVQTAIYGILTADAALAEALGAEGSIVDHAGENPRYPYVAIGAYTIEGHETKRGVWRPVAEITCASSARGMRELNSVMDAAAAALSGQALGGTSFTAGRGSVVGAEADVDVDPTGELVRIGRVRIAWVVYMQGD